MALTFWPLGHASQPAPQLTVPVGSNAFGAAAALGTVCWLLSAGVYVAAKWAATEMPPWTLTFWRPLLAGLTLLPFVARHVPEMLDLLRARPLPVFIVGGLGLAISQGCIYTGLRHTTAVNAGLIMALAPIITLLVSVSHYVLAEALGPWQFVGSLIALAGMVVIISQGAPAACCAWISAPATFGLWPARSASQPIACYCGALNSRYRGYRCWCYCSAPARWLQRHFLSGNF